VHVICYVLTGAILCTNPIYPPYLPSLSPPSPISQGHVVHETLYGSNMVEAYEVYIHKDRAELYCILKVGSRLNGYPGT
jgi:hypothetical protein